ncbi:MAG TPA: molecular chaperone TorD family protein [Caldimonas sp.]|nr:molecular chaperone TorD family protein [Caldimonas sp.]HEX4234470.1 molecular chaperone TorD family protein [Caldimonas sp.]
MSTAAPQPIGFAAGDDAEELARAEVYGLLAALFYAPPSAELYAQFQVAVTQAPVAGAFLEKAWSELVGAARRLPRDDIEREFDRLFQGVGKPEIFLYGSFYVAGKLNEKPLVALRHSLRALGIARSEAMSETEDHIAGVCEVMRYLIAGGDAGTSNLAGQRRFFEAHLRPWVGAMCSAIEAQAGADFYAALARFAADFFAVEGQAFDLLDA